MTIRCLPFATRRLFAVSVVIIMVSLFVSEERSAAKELSFEQRAQQTISRQADSAIDWNHENSFKMAAFVAQANFAIGRPDRAQEILRRLYSVQPLTDYFDPEFPLWSTMDCYMRWHDVPGMFTPDLQQQTKDYVAAATTKSGATTYNHHWMLSTGLILANQVWGSEVVSYRYSESDPTGKIWVMNQFDRIVHRGHPEMLADTYSQFEIGSLLSLAQFCHDPQIVTRATLTLDWLMLHRAAYFMNGHTVGPARRTYHPIQSQNNAQLPNWLYFGGPVSDKSPMSERPAVGAALADYRPPAECMAIAWEKTYPYQIVSSVVDLRIERLISHVEDGYALFSQYNRRNNLGPRSSYYHELLSWAVRWDAPRDQLSTFMIKQPCPKQEGRLLLGDTPQHQVLQHDRTLIGIINSGTERPPEIDKKSWCAKLLGAYPTVCQASIDQSDSGRLFLHYGSVMIAVNLTEPFLSSSTGGISQFTIPATHERLVVGYAVETSRGDAYDGVTPESQLAAFAIVASERFDRMRFDAKQDFPELYYEAIDSTELQLGWRPTGVSSVREINRQRIPSIDDNHLWPLIQAPQLSQSIDGALVVTTATETITYDFQDWTVGRATR